MSSTTLSIEGLLRNLFISGKTGSNRVSVSDVISRMIDGNTLSIRHYTKNVACRILRIELRSGIHVENARRVLMALLQHYPGDSELSDLLESFGGDFGRHSVFTHVHDDWAPSPSPTLSVYQRLSTPTARRPDFESYKKSVRVPTAFSADSILRDISSSDSEEEVLVRPVPALSRRFVEECKPRKNTHIYRLERIFDMKKHRDNNSILKVFLHRWKDYISTERNKCILVSRFVKSLQEHISTQCRRSLYLLANNVRHTTSFVVSVPHDASRMGYVFEKIIARRKLRVFSDLSGLVNLHSSMILATQQEEVWAVRSLLTSKVLRIAQSRITERHRIFAKKCFKAWFEHIRDRRVHLRTLVLSLAKCQQSQLRDSMRILSRVLRKKNSKNLAVNLIFKIFQNRVCNDFRFFCARSFAFQFGLERKTLGIFSLVKNCGHFAANQQRFALSRLKVDQRNRVLNAHLADQFVKFQLRKRSLRKWSFRIRVGKRLRRMETILDEKKLEFFQIFFRNSAKLRLDTLHRKLAITQIVNWAEFRVRRPLLLTTLSRMRKSVAQIRDRKLAFFKISKVVLGRISKIFFILNKPRHSLPNCDRVFDRHKRQTCFRAWRNQIQRKRSVARLGRILHAKHSNTLQTCMARFSCLVVSSKLVQFSHATCILERIGIRRGFAEFKRKKVAKYFCKILVPLIDRAKLCVFFHVFAQLRDNVTECLLSSLDREFCAEVADRERAALEVETAARELHEEYGLLSQKTDEFQARNEELENELVIVQAHYERVSRDSENLLFKLSGYVQLETEHKRLQEKMRSYEDLKVKLHEQTNELGELRERMIDFDKLNSSVSFYKSKCLLQAEQIGSLQNCLRETNSPRKSSPSSVRSRLGQLPFNGYCSPNSSRYSMHAGSQASTHPTYPNSLDNLKRAVDRSASMSRIRRDSSRFSQK